MSFNPFSFPSTAWDHCLPSLCSAMLPISCTVLVTICLFLWLSSSIMSWKYSLPWLINWFFASFIWAKEQRQIVAASTTSTEGLLIKGETLMTPFRNIIEFLPSSLKEIEARLLITNYFTTSESFDNRSKRSVIAVVDRVWLIAFYPSNKEFNIYKFLIRRCRTFSSFNFLMSWGRIEVFKTLSFPSWVSE